MKLRVLAALVFGLASCRAATKPPTGANPMVVRSATVTDLSGLEQPLGGGSIERFTITMVLPHAGKVTLTAPGAPGYGPVLDAICTRGTRVFPGSCEWDDPYGGMEVVGTFDAPITGDVSGTLHFLYDLEIDGAHQHFAVTQSGVHRD